MRALIATVFLGAALLTAASAPAQVFVITTGRLGGTADASAPPAATRCVFACAEGNGFRMCEPDPPSACDTSQPNSPGNSVDIRSSSTGSAGTSGGLDDPNISTTYASVDAMYARTTNPMLGVNGFSLTITKQIRKGNAVGPRSGVPGACCNGGSCTVVFSFDCFGDFLGDGTSCGPNNTCPPREGACCVNGGCTLQLRDACNMLSGTFYGPASACAAQGACPGNFSYFASANTQGGFEVAIQALPGVAAFTFTETGSIAVPGDPKINPIGAGAGFVTVNGETLLLPGIYRFDDLSVNADSSEPVGTATETYSFAIGLPLLGACCSFSACAVTGPNECGGGAFLGLGTACGPTACTGACCVGPALCVQLVETECLARGGAFRGAGSVCGQVSCAGSCCSPTAGCAFVANAPCPTGSSYGTPGPCQPLSCVGACCSPAGACTLVSASECSQSGGAFRGIGFACAPFLCVGACCGPDGSCSFFSQVDCVNRRGLFVGYFSLCAGSPCYGACCLGAGCVVENNGICNNFGAPFRGLGTACAPGTCAGACCLRSECFLLDPDACARQGGMFLGTDTTCDGAPCCCQPWDNGRPDGRGGQASSLGVSPDWRPLVNAAFDDLWLCEGSIHDIDIIRGTLNTNATLPKAIVAVFPDCNGLPDLMRPLAVAGLSGTRFHVSQEDVPFVLGEIALDDSGTPDADGYRPIGVTATFGGKPLVLRGGAYWVTIVGFSADLNPFDEYFWATSGNLSIKGRPGQFFDGEEFRGSEELCCGCTDYNFCVLGETCKILLDNGGPLALDSIGVPGSPSLQNGASTQTRSRAADRFVFPPCTLLRPCYVEAWLWTNCDRAGLEFYPNGCACPPAGPLAPGHLTSDCVMATGVTTIDGSGVAVELKKFQFFLNNPPALEQMLGRPSRDGANVWISVFGLGDNRQNARAYFAYNDRCERPCDQTFGPGCIRSAPADQNLWRSNATVPSATTLGRDYAFMIAVTDLSPAPPPAAVVPACPADLDRSGTLTVQDLFDFLAAWFAGCP